MFRIRIRSRHPSHDPLRDSLPKMPVRSIVRLGSTSEINFRRGKTFVEVNTAEAISNSANKLRMKECFQSAEVKTADWMPAAMFSTFSTLQKEKKNVPTIMAVQEGHPNKQIEFPIVAKQIFGSRGRGNTLIHNPDELRGWLAGKTLANYIFEKFYSYNKEYRLHVTREGCFYTCRKMLKEDTPKADRWYRNDSNSVWVTEENALFERPKCWDAMVVECVKALNACGLDFGACDVRVQSSDTKKEKERKTVDFIIIEINSAPSFGTITLERYLEQLPRIIESKIKK